MRATSNPFIVGLFVALAVAHVQACAASSREGHARRGAKAMSSIKAPIYFNFHAHAEGVGNPCPDGTFNPDFDQFKNGLQAQLTFLEEQDVVTDQCFSDYVVSVILYRKWVLDDEDADHIFTWFQNSRQNLGYHFHPATAEPDIRQKKVEQQNLPFDQAVARYERWESAYYDWEP